MRFAWHLPTPLIAAALALDLLLGDPAWLPHPVRLVGRAIDCGERILRTGDERRDLRGGTALALAIVALAGLVTWALIAVLGRLSPTLGACAAVTFAWTTLALRGLDQAAAEVGRCLARSDIDAARRALPALVGRDPQALDRDAIVRATVESVAENCSDGVVAPVLFLFVGGPVAAIGYKAINTLDSMIGYRGQRYLYFGRCAARLDDFANLVPARLTALCLSAAAACFGRGAQALATCRADAHRHQSPNAGFPEAAMAGALGIQLGGDAVYDGVLECRAWLGRPERQPTLEDITAARKLLHMAALLAFAVLAATRAGLAKL